MRHVSALRSCKNLPDIHRIHNQALRDGLEQELALGNVLLQKYGSHGPIEDAISCFDKLKQRSRTSWNLVIRACTRHGQITHALELFVQMYHTFMPPDEYVFASIASAGFSLDCIADGRLLHRLAVCCGCDTDTVVGTTIISMYGKCESLADARHTFDHLPTRNEFSWNVIITVNTELGYPRTSVHLFHEMQKEGVQPCPITFLSVYDACATLGDCTEGKRIHACTVGSELEVDLKVSTALVNMYSKCGCLAEAHEIFDRMPNQDLVSWNSMVAAYAQQGSGCNALQVFRNMLTKGIQPNKITWVCVLDACADEGAIAMGRSIHIHIMDSAIEYDVILDTALIDMYGKCGSLEDARNVFDSMPERNIACWNALIDLYACNKEVTEVCHLFNQLLRDGLVPDVVTFLNVLNGCTSQAALYLGKCVHCHLLASEFEIDVVMGSALVNMYGKCGDLRGSRTVFDKMSVHNAITYVNLLSACANLGALAEGRRVHALIKDNGIEVNMIIGTALVNLYGKCGMLGMARDVFSSLLEKNIICWNALLSAYTHQGQGKCVVDLFDQLLQDGQKPDEVTFVTLLSACSHSGLLDEGRRYFSLLKSLTDLKPMVDHFNCYIDMLGRAGLIEEAENLIKSMPVKPEAATWATLLSACQYQIDVARGERIAHLLFQLDPQNSNTYVSLANLYAKAGRENDAQAIIDLMRKKGLKRQSGFSTIEVNGQVHHFGGGITCHAQMLLIQDELSRWDQLMEGTDWSSESGMFSHTEPMFCAQSERQAIAFGLLNTAAGTPIFVTKNYQLCSGCHHAIKFASKVSQREIIVRDPLRFHFFRNGICSCGDTW